MTDQPQFRLGDGSEGAHWYRQDGIENMGEARCCYQILGKNGKWRATNLRDARAHGLLPSVSAITRIEAAPGLEKWKRRQMMFAALTHPDVATTPNHDELFKLLEKDGAQQAKEAAKEGTNIHAAVEKWFLDGTGTPVYDAHISAATTAIDDVLGRDEWFINELHTEVAVTHAYGYGGRVDLMSLKHNVVFDFKSKEFGRSTKLDVYANQGQALAAYREALGLPNARCFNIYLSRNNPGLYRVCEHPQEKLANYWEQFVALLHFWQIKSNMPTLARQHYETQG